MGGAGGIASATGAVQMMQQAQMVQQMQRMQQLDAMQQYQAQAAFANQRQLQSKTGLRGARQKPSKTLAQRGASSRNKLDEKRQLASQTTEIPHIWISARD
jgi:hypothetical protein